jgi:hypothetical protein
MTYVRGKNLGVAGTEDPVTQPAFNMRCLSTKDTLKEKVCSRLIKPIT